MRMGFPCVVAIVAFVVSCADGARLNPNEACQENEVIDCLTPNFEAIANAKTQQDIDTAFRAICSGKKEPCTDLHAAPECPDETRKALALVEDSLAAAIDALCANNGDLLKKAPEMFQCWNWEKFSGCVERIPLTATRLEFFTSKRTPNDLQTFRTELPKCIQLSRNFTKACESATIKPVQMFLDTFFEKSVPGYSGNKAAKTGSSLAAFLSIVLALVFSRHA